MPTVDVLVSFDANKPTPMLESQFRIRLKIAISAAISRIYSAEQTIGIPVITGNLRDTFNIIETDNGLRMIWGATSPTGYKYAKVVDEGGPFGKAKAMGIPANFKQPMIEVAKQILIEEIEKAMSGEWT